MTIRHYVLGEQIGAGGMGIVFRAHDTQLDRPVALKFLPPHLTEDEDAAQRLLVEARAAARLDHPNICTIHEVGTLDDGRPFIAMAHYEGETLTRIIRNRRVPPAEAVALAVQIAAGLGRAHESDIIHRDIKPANVLLTDDGQVKILDFGIAKISGVDLTQSGAALGTVAYMSPEQIRGDGLDARTDLWSLGVVLYELCSGERPFIGPDHVATMHGILELDPPPLDQMIPGFPTDLWDVVARCVEKDPDRRHPDAGGLVAALEACLTGPTSTAQRTETPDEAPVPSLAAEGERRQATVLTAQLAGRGALEEALSPGEADRVLELCRDTMTTVVEEFGGVVNRNTGETLEALFGIPASQEDDAIRAVRASTAVCKRVRAVLADAGGGEGVGLRCGVDTGRVVARRDDTGGSAYRVAGDATELSARLAGQARVGEVVISDSCRRAVGPFLEVSSAGSLRRDDDETTETFRVLGETGVRSRIEAAAEAENLTALAGRDAELETLMQACRAAGAGQGRFVSIVGDAGAGKSRLLYEFHERLDRSRFDIIRGRCQSFGSDVPYLPFIDALRDRLMLPEIGGGETPELVAERVAEVSPDLADFTPFYLQLLSLGETEEDENARLAGQEVWAGEQHRVGLVESLSALFTLGARDRPTVALLEDWHWVDTASRQVLQQLLEMVSAYPLLIVVTARPDGDLGWGTPAEHTPIVLGPLSPDDSGVIIRSAMDAEEVSAALTRLLHDRTGGNPFFLEEVCRALSEAGTLKVDRGRVVVAGPLDNLQLPDTVQGVLRTRLDRLDGDTRRLVRYASVIGREFNRDVLEHALADDTNVSEELDRLRASGLIQQIRVVPTPTYRFKHALTQEVAYDGLLERQRAEIHGAIGEALEALRPDRLDEHLDRLAVHFAVAERWEKAVDYAIASTDRLRSFSEFAEAAETQERALEWVEHLDDNEARFERRVDMLLRQERLNEYLGLRARQQELINDLLECLDPEEHADKIAVTYVRQGDLYILKRDDAGAEEALDTALRISRETGDRATQRHALRSMGLLRWHQQRHEEAVELVDRALELDREAGNQEAVVGDLSNLGALYRSLGQYDRALEYLHEALEAEMGMERRSASPVVKESYILHTIGVTHSKLGDLSKARDYLERAKTAAETGSAVFNVVQMHFHVMALARLDIEEGRMDEALTSYQEAIDLCRRTRHIEGLTTSLRVRGDVLLNLGRHAEALSDLEEAASLYEHLEDQPGQAVMLRGVAQAREALGDAAGALEAWQQTRVLGEGLDDPDLTLLAAEGVARLLRREDPSGSLEAYETALALTLDGGDLAKIGGLRYSIGILRWEFGAYDDALVSFEQAYEDLSAAPDLPHAGLVLNSIGRTLRDLGRFDDALSRLDASIELNQTTGEKLLVAHAQATAGDVLLDSGNPEDAIERFEAALEIRKQLDDLTGQGWVLCSLAKAQLARGSSEGAAYYLAEVEDIASRSNDPELQGRCDAIRVELQTRDREA
ncbi:MAG: tetratricopeptide repeat protein [Gemmatimonadota bacterium]